jgi:hypothetical protein
MSDLCEYEGCDQEAIYCEGHAAELQADTVAALEAGIDRLTAEVIRQRRHVQNLLDIISEHKVCTDDMEDSCIRIAAYEKDGKVWPPDYLRDLVLAEQEPNK